MLPVIPRTPDAGRDLACREGRGFAESCRRVVFTAHTSRTPGLDPDRDLASVVAVVFTAHTSRTSGRNGDAAPVGDLSDPSRDASDQRLYRCHPPVEYLHGRAIDTGAIGAHCPAVSAHLQTVVETPACLAAARGVLSDAERTEVVTTVAETPKAGAALGGGIRKMRIARPGRGKSGGARVVYLFSGEDIPVFLLTVFAKNEKSNLGTRERTALIAAAKQMVEDYRKRK